MADDNKDDLDAKAAEEKKKLEEQGDAVIANMSDEDFLKLDEPPEPDPDTDVDTKDDESASGGSSEEDKSDKDDDDKSDDDSDDDKKEDKKDDASDESDEDKDAADDDDKDSADDKVDDKDNKSDKSDKDDKDNKDDKDEDKSDKSDKKDKDDKSDGIDYKAEYEKLTAPFKANGIDMKVESAEDAVALMQMGANYHKKMAALKPSLKVLKLLENNKLLDESKLHFLIDLHKKDPEAIKKFFEDSKLDPLDVDMKTESNYTPTSRPVTDTEVELDQVLEGISDTKSYAKTLNVITKQWDEKSRSELASNPQIISVINAQIEDGVYDVVAAQMVMDRSLGKLNGLSDFDAYKVTGDRLDKEGKLEHLLAKPPAVEKKDKDIKQKSDPKKEKERLKRKKAAGSTKKIGGNSSEKTFDPLNMSDEDFEKFDIKELEKANA